MQEIYELEDIQENEKQDFIIDTPLKADWAVKVIKQEQAENQRLQSVIDDEIELLKLKKQKIADSLENKIGYLQGKLFEYFKTVEARELKQSYRYTLPSGTLIMNKPTVKYERDDEKILKYLLDNNKFEYIDVVHKLKWSELKNNENLENIDGITKIEIPENFIVK